MPMMKTQNAGIDTTNKQSGLDGSSGKQLTDTAIPMDATPISQVALDAAQSAPKVTSYPY